MALEALIRNGTRDRENFIPIGIEEALRTATMWLSPLVHNQPEAVTLCVGRNADFQLACDWADKAGTKNLFSDRALSAANAPHARTKNKTTSLILAFGSGTGTGAKETQTKLAQMRQQGAKIISINPVKTGLSVLADQWLAIRPGSDRALLEVLSGKKPCDYNQLASTDLSVLVVERLLREIEAHQGEITVIAGRGIFAHRDGSQTVALLKTLDADILPTADHANAPRKLSTLLEEDCEALLCMASDQPWQSQSVQELQNYEGRIICLSENPAGFESSADLVFCGNPEDNLLKLSARLGLPCFSDVEGNSPFENGYADYVSIGAKVSPKHHRLKVAKITEPDANYPFHAISQKAHADANRSVVFMNTNKAKFLGLSAKDIVSIKSATGNQKALLALMDDMNENTLWSWGGTLFSPLMPQDTPLRDATTGQPAWFDLQVTVEKALG